MRASAFVKHLARTAVRSRWCGAHNRVSPDTGRTVVLRRASRQAPRYSRYCVPSSAETTGVFILAAFLKSANIAW